MTEKISLVKLAQQTITAMINPGDIAIDATVGNGHDCLFLSNAVGARGHVYGYDIQQQALDNTRQLLIDNNCNDNVTLIKSCHSNIDMLPEQSHGNITAVMFNLGYLPGGDKQLITSEGTTIAALKALLALLADKAIVSILAYRGHPGGEQEADSIIEFCKTLDAALYRHETKTISATKTISPILITIQNQFAL